MPSRWELNLHVVQTAPYPHLAISDMVRADWTLSHVVRGNVTTVIGGVRYPVRPGDLMVHPPHVPFSEFADGPGVHQWCAFDARLLEAVPIDLFTHFPLPPVLPLGNQQDTYHHAFVALETAANTSASTNRDLKVVSALSQLFAVALEAWEDAGKPTRPETLYGTRDRFSPILAYLNDHLHERLTREELAKRAFLHPGSFDRAFRQTYGIAPMRLLQKLRLDRARHLLESTDDTLETIAEACGLSDATRLSRLFRARFGESPGRWREGVKSTRRGYLPLWSDAPSSSTM